MKGNSQVLVLGAAGNKLARVDEEAALAEEDTGEYCRVVDQGIPEDKAGIQADSVQAPGLTEDMARGVVVCCLGPGKTSHTQEDSSHF